MVVDRLTKYVHFMPLSHLYTAVKVVVVLIRKFFALWHASVHCE